jgi:hypothetical protein
LADRILAVIADFGPGFMYFLAALIAKPDKPIYFSRPAFALKHDKPGVFCEPG